VDTDVTTNDDWHKLVGFFPADIEEMARRTGALIRKRGVRSALDLVRIALVYGQDDACLRDTSVWAKEAGVANLSDVATLKRLRSACGLLRELCSRFLESEVQETSPEVLRLILVDSTSVSRRRAKGTDFRVHMNYSVTQAQISGAELTRVDGGERLDRLPCGPGDVLVADSGYPSRVPMAEVRARGAHLIVRFYPSALPVQDEQGVRLDVLALCGKLEIGDVLDLPVWTIPKKDAPAIAGRIVALRKTEEQAQAQLERTRKNSGKPPSPEAELAARYILIFTTLDSKQASALTVLESYRLRWQIEMAFKQAKGVVSLGETAARDMALCECKILAKLLLLLLIQKFKSAFFPWGYPLPRFQSVARA
jgi:hypothetical protein